MQGLYTTVPNGFLLCNGQEVAIASFPELYAVIGTLEGCQSENEGMFKVPDLRGRFLEGATGNLGNRIEAGLPNITGSFIPGSVPVMHFSFAKDAFGGTVGSKDIICNQIDKKAIGYGYDFDASRSNSIYGKSSTVQPPAVCVNYIIKY